MSFGEISEEKAGSSISVINFWAGNCLAAPCDLEQCHGVESNHWAKILLLFYAQLHVTASEFQHNKLGWLLNEADSALFQNIFIGSVRSWTVTSFIIFHVFATIFVSLMPLKKHLTF
jgi:hypothetical protein